jgi:hypothetical protein
MKEKKVCLLLMGCCVIFALGCPSKKDEAGRKNISGVVTLDGTPLQEGNIQFSPLDTQAPQGAGVIGGTTTVKDGKYELKRDLGLYAGTYQVSITHTVIIDLKTNLPAEDPSQYYETPGAYRLEHTIPDKYNTKTTLEITVGEEKNQTHDFALTK